MNKPDMTQLDQEMRNQLAINDADIVKELIDHPTKQFYWGSMWARARKQERTQELAVETLEAQLSSEYRKAMALDEPNTRVTEKMVKEHIASHPAYIEAMQKEIQLSYMADIFHVCKNAFETRGRLLLELSKQLGEGKFYENEFENMKNEFERREEEKAEALKNNSKQ